MNTAKRAVIDIGSNAIRFVAYGGPPRAPIPIYNEKLPVSFGKSVLKYGMIDAPSLAQALTGLTRFKHLSDYLDVQELRVVATAAVRDATNGQMFIARAAELGVVVELMTGEQEALAAGMGVLCDTPWADGYVCDLGGGSLELVRVLSGKLGARASLPMGTLRIAGKVDMQTALHAHLSQVATLPVESELNLYLVGGAWRAMARVDQQLLQARLTVISNYEVKLDRLESLATFAQDLDAVKALRIIPAQRAETLRDAARLAQSLAGWFNPAQIFTSAVGIREGLLFDALSKAEAGQDPLLACTRWEGKRLSRALHDGDGLADWMKPLFADEPASHSRLRRAACNLADANWNIHPDYRASHALQHGLHGNWLGIDHAGRILLARALFAAHGGKEVNWPNFGSIVSAEALSAGTNWGLAIRLAMRIDAGTGAALSATRIECDEQVCMLHLPKVHDLGTVERRLKALAASIGCKSVIKPF